GHTTRGCNPPTSWKVPSISGCCRIVLAAGRRRSLKMDDWRLHDVQLIGQPDHVSRHGLDPEVVAAWHQALHVAYVRRRRAGNISNVYVFVLATNARPELCLARNGSPVNRLIYGIALDQPHAD